MNEYLVKWQYGDEISPITQISFVKSNSGEEAWEQTKLNYQVTFEPDIELIDIRRL